MNAYKVVRNDDCLQHHGILGQKWGIRRFQNEDGTLTPAGRARYLKTVNQNGKQITGITKEAINDFFKRNSYELSDNGKKMLSKMDKHDPIRELVETYAFESKYSENWLDSYNRAADEGNKMLDRVNAKYKDVDFSKPENENAYKEYLHECADGWEKAYGDILLQDFGEHPQLGKDWLQNALFYGMYRDML